MATAHNSSIDPLEAQTPPLELVVKLTLTPNDAAKLRQLVADINQSSRELGERLGLETIVLTPEEYAAQMLLTALHNA